MKYAFHGFYRFWLAIFVLVSHYFLYFFPEVTIMGMLQLGNIAVASFFVLSGYLMNEAFFNFYKDKPINFILNRYIRITPLFFLAGVLSVLIHIILLSAFEVGSKEIPDLAITNVEFDSAVLSIFGSVFPFNVIIFKLWSIFQAQVSHDYEFVRYSWAIFTEMIFYWCIFCFYLLKKKFSVISYVFIFFTLVFVVLAIFSVHLNLNIPMLWAQHFQWGGHFLLGVCVSILISVRNNSRIVIFGSLCALALAYVQFFLYVSKSSEGGVVAILLYSLCLVAFYLIVARGKNFWGMSIVNDQKWGNYSYPIYINQYGLSLLFIGVVEVSSGGVDGQNLFIRILIFLVYLSFIILCSHFLERCSDYLTTSIRNKVRGTSI